MSRCNFCTLKDLRTFAARAGKEAVLVQGNRFPSRDPEREGHLPGPGWDVFIVMPGERPDEHSSGWAAWFWEISEACVC